MLPWLVSTFQGYSLLFKFIFSDIDLVVLGKWATLPLETLAASLREKQVAAPDTLEVRGKAKVFLLNSFYLYLKNIYGIVTKLPNDNR